MTEKLVTIFLYLTRYFLTQFCSDCDLHKFNSFRTNSPSLHLPTYLSICVGRMYNGGKIFI